jgi:hypothetical protein
VAENLLHDRELPVLIDRQMKPRQNDHGTTSARHQSRCVFRPDFLLFPALGGSQTSRNRARCFVHRAAVFPPCKSVCIQPDNMRSLQMKLRERCFEILSAFGGGPTHNSGSIIRAASTYLNPAAPTGSCFPVASFPPAVNSTDRSSWRGSQVRIYVRLEFTAACTATPPRTVCRVPITPAAISCKHYVQP